MAFKTSKNRKLTKIISYRIWNRVNYRHTLKSTFSNDWKDKMVITHKNQDCTN